MTTVKTTKKPHSVEKDKFAIPSWSGLPTESAHLDCFKGEKLLQVCDSSNFPWNLLLFYRNYLSMNCQFITLEEMWIFAKSQLNTPPVQGKDFPKKLCTDSR